MLAPISRLWKGAGAVAPAKPTARYLRPEKTGVLAMRQAVTRDSRLDVREAADRASALAVDFMRNSGWIAGAVDQIIADTIGTELNLSCRPELSAAGFDEKERADWCSLVEAEWSDWAKNPAECDLAGKATVAEMCDGVMRSYLASGEAVGIVDYLTVRQRTPYRIRTGTKLSLVEPHRLKRETREGEGLFDGIWEDQNGRPTHFRFRKREGFLDRDEDVPAFDAFRLKRVLHLMDRGVNINSRRGISPITPVLKVAAQHDQLADAVLAQALMHAIFAATIKSPEPSEQAFQAIQTLSDTMSDVEGAETLAADLIEVWGQRIDALKNNGISMADPARINHLGPGEEFQLHALNTPGSNYLPFSQNLQREIARCLGILFEAMTMDFRGATYSSVRMGVSYVWPTILRRRSRIVAPFCQGAFEPWLDEQVYSGAIPFKGGYPAFVAIREKATRTVWRGPAKPVADDLKAAQGAEKRLQTGVSSLADECAEYGRDWEEVARQRAREKAVVVDELGLPDPFQKMTGGAGPNGNAVEGDRSPAGADA